MEAICFYNWRRQTKIRSSSELYHGGFETGTEFWKGKEIHKIALSPHRLRKNILDPAMQEFPVDFVETHPRVRKIVTDKCRKKRTYVNSLAVKLEKSVNEILDEMDRDVEH